MFPKTEYKNVYVSGYAEQPRHLQMAQKNSHVNDYAERKALANPPAVLYILPIIV